jgi:hypothetical protein
VLSKPWAEDRVTLGEPWIRNVPFTKQSQTDCTSASACAGRTCSLVWLKSAKRTGRLATARRNTRNRFTEQATLEDRMKDAVDSEQLTRRRSLRRSIVSRCSSAVSCEFTLAVFRIQYTNQLTERMSIVHAL